MACGLAELVINGVCRLLPGYAPASAVAEPWEFFDFTVTLFPPALNFRDLSVCDKSHAEMPGLHLDRATLNFSPFELARRRFICDNVWIEGLDLTATDADRSQTGNTLTHDRSQAAIMASMDEPVMEWFSIITHRRTSILDLNELEMLEAGAAVYAKWEVRFKTLSSRATAVKADLQALMIQFDNAVEGDTLERIEQFVPLSQRAKKILVEVQQLQKDVAGIVSDVRDDIRDLEVVRQRDQEKVLHRLSLLKPDGTQISQRLIAELMCRKSHHVLSSVRRVGQTRDLLLSKMTSAPHAGRNFHFTANGNSPQFLIKSMTFNGLLSYDNQVRSFHATALDFSEDQKAVGRPCNVSLATVGIDPLQLNVVFDVENDIPVTQALAHWHEAGPVSVTSGSREEASIHATLNDLDWTGEISMSDGLLEGQVRLSAKVHDLQVRAGDDQRDAVPGINESLSVIRTMNATVVLNGTIERPLMNLETSIGDEVIAVLTPAIEKNMTASRNRFLAEVNLASTDQMFKLKDRFSDKYDVLKKETHEALVTIQRVAAYTTDWQAGKINQSPVRSSASRPQRTSPESSP